MRSIAMKPTAAKVPATSNITRLELCMASSSPVRCDSRAFSMVCSLPASRSEFCGGRVPGFFSVLLDRQLRQNAAVLQLQVSAQGFLVVGLDYRGGAAH